jgi:hypothetical protein
MVRLLSLWSNHQFRLSSGSLKGYHLQVNETIIQVVREEEDEQLTFDHVDSPILKINS